MFKYAFADRIKKFVYEIDDMPYEEFIHWKAYSRIIERDA